MKHKLYKILEKGAHGKRLNLFFDYFIMSLIILSVISIVLESISEVNMEYGNYLRAFNLFSIVVFTIEYLLRLYVSDLMYPSNSRLKSALKFIFSPYGLIDLLSILPFYLPLIFKIDLRFLRTLRLMRFLRILKINRYDHSFKLIWDVIKEKKSELGVTGFVTFLTLLVASFLMYYVEGEKQPELFPNVLESFWWAISTLTTVGYGDVYPITAMGKVISGVIALMGIGIVALPTGIVSAGFISKVQERKRPANYNTYHCPHCGEELPHSHFKN
ncbi:MULTISPECIES: ion transporter [unclassified Lentimicrobium]|uniref:ion transporter n=1 Tax=unclassified Lentimicrobium TaxID=2677434 RepID=UPI001556FF25|nr:MULTISPECIES: ion transporter [unclassified Lentimicrobium]NPD44402.1 ion transporter [Lentimicrobium sp. S6]NPD84332.1 ion transporter [Lentimicrobium sp. L6]